MPSNVQIQKMQIAKKNLRQKVKDTSLEVECSDSPESLLGDSKVGIGTRRRAKVKPVTAIQRIFANRMKVKNHYFAAGEKINEQNARDLFNETSPFKYPKPTEEFSYKVLSKNWNDNLRKKELSYKCAGRNNYRTRQNLDKLNRMYVKEPEMATFQTILDLDPNFFSIIEGRPLVEKFSVREYVKNVRNVLVTKIICGYRDDDNHVIQEKFVTEQKIINEVKRQHQMYTNSFEEFLADDHNISMALLRRAEKEANLAIDKYEEYLELSKDYGILKYNVYNLEDKWRNCKVYQKFLYTLSPVYWRRKHDFYHLQLKGSHLSLVAEDVIATKENVTATGEELPLEVLIEHFLDDIRTEDNPMLYFNDPNQLLKVFKFTEIQNLNILLHTEELAVPTQNVREGIANARLVFENEIAQMKDVTENLEGEIIWEEQRAQALKDLALELINVDFKNLVANEEALDLYIFVEDVYEAHIAPNDSNIGIYEMMRAIKIKYRHMVLTLDSLPQDHVRRAEKECFAELTRNMKIAELAAKKVIQIQRLTRRLHNALAPPFQRPSRVLMKRSPPRRPRKKPPPPLRELEFEEKEFLTYFTEFCELTDDVADYGISLTEYEKQRLLMYPKK